MTHAAATPDPPSVRPLGVGRGLLVGVLSAVVGLVPWLVTGARLPVQNLWSDEANAARPLVLLPFSQYAITTLIGLLVVGAAVAGLTARIRRARDGRERIGRRGFGAILLGVLAAQVAAVAQTTHAVSAGLPAGRTSALYLAALVGVAGLSIAVGLVVLPLVARAPRGGALLGLGIGALALTPWLGALLVPFGTIDPGPAVLAVLPLLRWVAPVLIGAALAWSGLNTVGRVLAGLVDLGLLWLVPALTTAVTNAAGSRALLRDPTELLAYAVEVFRAASTQPALVLPPLVLAVVVAVLGLALRRLVRRRPASAS